MAEFQHVTGLPELKARLEQLPREIAAKVLRHAVATGARVVRDEAVARAPIGANRRGIAAPGTLRRAIVVKLVRELTNDEQVEYIVAVRQGKRQQKYGRDAFYARFVEFGHRIVPRAARSSARGLRHRRIEAKIRGGGFVPPHRFLGPAFDASAQRALSAIVDEIGAGITRLDK